MTHTPGPWEVIYCNRDLPPHVVSKLRFKPVDVMIGDKRLRVSENESGDANARLIAAAPELLAALKGLEQALRQDSRDKTVLRDTVEYHLDGQAMYAAINTARAAIAKAEGRT